MPKQRVAVDRYGIVEGFRMAIDEAREVDLFLGIPFAKPPVGKLRFKVDRWKEINCFSSDNIHAFGGDPRLVTLFGQSAGGCLDLFHQVVPMAGNAECEWSTVSRTRLVNSCREFAARKGWDGKNYGKGMDVSKIGLDLAPVVGSTSSDFLPKSIAELRKEMPKKNIMVGTCEYEGLLFGISLQDLLRNNDCFLNLLFTLAATHCTELTYLFGVSVVFGFRFNDSDKQMIDLMTRMWTNFAKYGNPNGPYEDSTVFNFKWEPASLENHTSFLSISEKCEMRTNYKDKLAEFWKDIRIAGKSV
uniref:Carboxylic ester hydrolase n=1 Tax=Heterorhabditis bacteriophora TaxID=37862 RepID=A0A1I7X660_HETBA